MIRHVVIVGGGTTGWLSALYLAKFLGRRLNITIITPETIPPMAVGESTNKALVSFLERLCITKDDMILHADATLKVASEFARWHQEGAGSNWVHEFQAPRFCQGLQLFHFWLDAYKSGQALKPYQDACFNTSTIVRHCKSPISLDEKIKFEPYGYHFDVYKFIKYLKQKALELGVKAVHREVKGLEKNESGFIKELILDGGERLPGDFFLDCTGFKSLVMSMAYEVPFENFSDYLLCDSAVAIMKPRQSTSIRPSTLGTALGNGWVWDIPLIDRDSLGYVYSSHFLSKDEAERDFRRFIDYSEGEVSHLRWTAGMRQRAWVKNCVCIGVSNSFVEPLESITSFMLTLELTNLLILFPDETFNQFTIDRYNKIVREQCLDNRDFISVHYATTGRNDTSFWRTINNDVRLSDQVKNLLESYPQQAPFEVERIYETKAFYGLFCSRNIFPQRPLPLFNYVSRNEAVAQFEEVEKSNAFIVEHLPSHYQYLMSVHQRVRASDDALAVHAGSA